MKLTAERAITLPDPIRYVDMITHWRGPDWVGVCVLRTFFQGGLLWHACVHGPVRQ